MTWKIEKWMNEIYPNSNMLFKEYESLKPRELAIVAASVMDLALVEMISKRLKSYPSEQEKFLGLDGDGRSPCGSFGSRIQLALLLGLIDLDDAEILRTIKNLRNLYAHRVKVHLNKNEGLKHSMKILEAYRLMLIKMLPKRREELIQASMASIIKLLKESEDTACLFLRTMLGTFQLKFKDKYGKIHEI